ncbi:MAG: hypothetical protein JHD35_10180 [Sphingopyxis sp.]|nr:hypothetical protein [Sphingopyxis sp.]
MAFPPRSGKARSSNDEWHRTLLSFLRHPGGGRDLNLAPQRTGEIPAFAGMTMIEGLG